MLKKTLNSMTQLDQDKSMQSETSMDFSLSTHYEERIMFHMKMLNYYFKELDNEKLAT